MKIGHIELFCDDVVSTTKFYTDILGFKLITDPNSKLAWVGLDGIEILLRKGSNDNLDVKEYDKSPQGLVLYTNNLQETKIDLEKRGLEFKGIDGSPKCLTFQDPSGHWWQLVNPEDH